MNPEPLHHGFMGNPACSAEAGAIAAGPPFITCDECKTIVEQMAVVDAYMKQPCNACLEPAGRHLRNCFRHPLYG